MRTAEHSARELGSRAARQRLPKRPRPYFTHVADGLSLGYRRGETGGSWIARAFDTEHGYRTKPLGKANDALETVGMSFQDAQTSCREWYGQLAQQDAGEPVAGRYTVAQAVNDYIADSEISKRKKLPKTRQLAKAHIVPTLGRIELGKLTHGKVRSWQKELASTAPRARTRPGKEQAYREHDPNDPDAIRRRQATANRILTVLKAALNHAKSESRRITTDAAWVDVKPFRNVDAPKIRFLAIDEVPLLVQACEPSIQTLVKAALLTGCRYGELTRMKVDAFNAEQGTVYVAESKNGEARYVDLGGAGIALFGELTADRDAKETIFLRFNGKAWKESEQQRPMDEACEAAKLKGVTFHILRHTYASHALMNGMTIEVLAQQLGHKDTRITMRHYAHLCPTFKQESVRRNAPSFGFDSPTGPTLVKKSA